MHRGITPYTNLFTCFTGTIILGSELAISEDFQGGVARHAVFAASVFSPAFVGAINLGGKVVRIFFQTSISMFTGRFKDKLVHFPR